MKRKRDWNYWEVSATWVYSISTWIFAWKEIDDDLAVPAVDMYVVDESIQSSTIDGKIGVMPFTSKKKNKKTERQIFDFAVRLWLIRQNKLASILHWFGVGVNTPLKYCFQRQTTSRLAKSVKIATQTDESEKFEKTNKKKKSRETNGDTNIVHSLYIIFPVECQCWGGNTKITAGPRRYGPLAILPIIQEYNTSNWVSYKACMRNPQILRN